MHYGGEKMGHNARTAAAAAATAAIA